MRKRLNALILCGMLGIMGFLHSCETNKAPLSPVGLFEFPMELGNRWEYERVLIFSTASSDSLIIDTTIVSQIDIDMEVISILEKIPPLYELREILTDDGFEYTDYSYYENIEDGLYFKAYRGAGFATPKTASNTEILINGKRFASLRAFIDAITRGTSLKRSFGDSLIVEDPPLLSIKYPLEVGAQWTYRTAGKPWRIDKKVVSYEPLRVPAGTFMCYKIQWLIDLNDDGNWDDNIVFYDYICPKGLAKRDIFFGDIAITHKGSTDPIGYYVSREVYELTDYHLRNE